MNPKAIAVRLKFDALPDQAKEHLLNALRAEYQDRSEIYRHVIISGLHERSLEVISADCRDTLARLLFLSAGNMPGASYGDRFYLELALRISEYSLPG